jgi:hypothetical protein
MAKSQLAVRHDKGWTSTLKGYSKMGGTCFSYITYISPGLSSVNHDISVKSRHR